MILLSLTIALRVLSAILMNGAMRINIMSIQCTVSSATPTMQSRYIYPYKYMIRESAKCRELGKQIE